VVRKEETARLEKVKNEEEKNYILSNFLKNSSVLVISRFQRLIAAEG
jgi:hypothetical protein